MTGPDALMYEVGACLVWDSAWVSADPAPAPSGVVTFLFTDVEGSTRRWEVDADVTPERVREGERTCLPGRLPTRRLLSGYPCCWGIG